MRVLLAPDCFGGSLTAAQAAEAMAAGWRAARPGDELALVPLSDGGPGFLDCLPGERHLAVVQGPLGEPVPAAFLLAGDTAWVESAQACGLHLTDRRDPTLTTSFGVGQLVEAAVELGARRIVVGLGGSATNDGGAGLLAALGLQALDGSGAPLPPGGLALARAARLTGTPVLTATPVLTGTPVPTGLSLFDGVALVAATDVDAPLLGPYGATAQFGPQKGATRQQVRELEAALAHWMDIVERHLGVQVRDLPGAGAAGGLGAALLALGATRVPGLQLVAGAVGLAAQVASADLVVTGEGAFDATSLRGKVVSGVAEAALQEAIPCLVIAGRVEVGHRQAAAAGVEATYDLTELTGERALADPQGALQEVGHRVACQWSR